MLLVCVDDDSTAATAKLGRLGSSYTAHIIYSVHIWCFTEGACWRDIPVFCRELQLWEQETSSFLNDWVLGLYSIYVYMFLIVMHHSVVEPHISFQDVYTLVSTTACAVWFPSEKLHILQRRYITDLLSFVAFQITSSSLHKVPQSCKDLTQLPWPGYIFLSSCVFSSPLSFFMLRSLIDDTAGFRNYTTHHVECTSLWNTWRLSPG